MVAAMPSARAASATPWAWLPDEKATTPRRPLRLAQLHQPVGRAAQFEAAALLQAFGLHPEPAPLPIERQQRRFGDRAGDAPRRSEDTVRRGPSLFHSNLWKMREIAGLYTGDQRPYIARRSPMGDFQTARLPCRQLLPWRSLELHSHHSALGLATAPTGTACGADLASFVRFSRSRSFVRTPPGAPPASSPRSFRAGRSMR